MSFSLWARPAPRDIPAPTYFSPQFKFAVAEAFFRDGHDGSMRRDILHVMPTVRNFAILDGMIAASGKGDFHDDAMKFRGMLDDNAQGIEIWIGDWNDHGGPEPEDDEEADIEPTTAPPELRHGPRDLVPEMPPLPREAAGSSRDGAQPMYVPPVGPPDARPEPTRHTGRERTYPVRDEESESGHLAARRRADERAAADDIMPPEGVGGH
jgi:hypothetical protein